jgi:L-arabinose isomerase
MEDYTYDFGAASTAVLGAHMLEVCPTIAAGKPSCEIHPLFVGEREDPVRLVFTGMAGPGLVVGMVDMGTHLRLVANEIDVIDPPRDLPDLPVARALWVPRPDFTTSAESWLLAGGPHHTAYTQAIDLETIEDFAEMVDVELLAIDADTNARQFRKEVRWSAAYRYLATRPA